MHSMNVLLATHRSWNRTCKTAWHLAFPAAGVQCRLRPTLPAHPIVRQCRAGPAAARLAPAALAGGVDARSAEAQGAALWMGGGGELAGMLCRCKGNTVLHRLWQSSVRQTGPTAGLCRERRCRRSMATAGAVGAQQAAPRHFVSEANSCRCSHVAPWALLPRRYLLMAACCARCKTPWVPLATPSAQLCR